MASDLNSVSLIGRLTADPQLQYLAQSGTAIATFSIASNYYAASKGDEVNYFEVTAFGKQAETINTYLKKGKQIAVYGTLRQERWQDKETGANRSKVKIILKEMQMLGSPQGSAMTSDHTEPSRAPVNTNQNQTPQNQTPVEPSVDMNSFDNEDDVPF